MIIDTKINSILWEEKETHQTTFQLRILKTALEIYSFWGKHLGKKYKICEKKIKIGKKLKL